MTQIDVDVLIVGGGPAGLATAAALPQSAKVLVVHQDREIGKPVRTSGGSWIKDLQALGVPPDLYHPISEIEFRSDNERALHKLSRHRMAVLDVTGLYQWLSEAAEWRGCDIRTGVKFLTAKEDSGGYLSTLRGRDEGEYTVRSRYVIDASGQAHAVVSALGLGPKPTRQGVGVEYEYELTEGITRRAVLFVGEAVLGGYGWIFPAPHGRVRIGAGVIHPDVETSPREIMEQLITPEFLNSYGLTLGELVHANAGILPSVAYDPRLVHGGVLRVGDTANFATPTVGEGIRQAIEFGRVLGAALGKTLETGNAAHLRRYEKLCARAFKRNYHYGFRANKRIAQYGPAEWDRSVRRLKRLSEPQMAALLRSEFKLSVLLNSALTYVRRRVFGG